MKKVNKEINRDILFISAQILLIIIVLMPVLMLSFYTLPGTDDFPTMNSIKNEILSGESIFTASLIQTWDRYMGWGGFYSGQFLNFLINPYLRWGVSGHHIVIAVINLFFAISLWILVRYCLKNLLYIDDLKIQLAFYIISLFIFLNLDYNSEIYFWYCVAVSYLLIISFMLCGIVFHIEAIRKRKRIWAVLAFITGFLVSGGALNVAALNCGIGFIILCVGGILTKNIKYSLSGFVGSFIGAIVNLAAPGNFSRHEGITNTYPVLGAFRMSGGLLRERILELFCNTPFILLLIGIFIISLKYVPFEKMKISFQFPAIPFLITVCGGAIINYPVCLGYANGYFPDRCVFVEDCIIYLGAIAGMVYLAGWSKKQKGLISFGKETSVCIIIAVCLFLCRPHTLNWRENCLSLLCINEIKSGRAGAYSDYWEGILSEIETSGEQDVIVLREEESPGNIFYTTGISDDADDWVNGALATYYGKDSVVLVTPD